MTAYPSAGPRRCGPSEMTPISSAAWGPTSCYGNVLIVGAGDGKLARELLVRRHRVHVLERALWVDGLDRVHRHAIAEGMLEITLSDYTRFECARRFETILWLSGDMALLPPGEQIAVLRSLDEHLTPGGRLIVELPRNNSWQGNNGFLPSIDRMMALGRDLDLGRLEVKLSSSAGDTIRYTYRDLRSAA